MYNHAWEIICVIFGHDWATHGTQSREDGMLLHDWYQCARCNLEKHDKSGFLKVKDKVKDYEEKYGPLLP